MTASQTMKSGARDVALKLSQAGFTAYWAGGCVRDLLLGHEPKDFDIATNAQPNDIISLFPGSDLTGKAFGVVRVVRAFVREAARESAQRAPPRTHHDHLPRRAGAAHRSPVERGDQARTDERGLAAARGADHREEPMRSEKREELGRLSLAPEEQPVLVGMKRSQTWKRIGEPIVRHRSSPPECARPPCRARGARTCGAAG